jgi:5-methylcytosine-specific restriction endonuclease McrA
MKHLDITVKMKATNKKNWRALILERDEYACQLCNDNTLDKLEAHHIKPRNLYPELELEVNNGICLCTKCHTRITGKDAEYEDEFIRILRDRDVLQSDE